MLSEPGGLWRLAVCATGICVCYLGYGYLFENIFTEKDHLGATFILVTQCATNVLVAYIWQQLSLSSSSPSSNQAKPEQQDAEKQLPLRHGLLLAASAAYVGAMGCSNEAVQYVSYPVAVLAKSCKLIPTMVVGQFIEGRLYSTLEWTAALLISCGIALFHFSRMQQQHQLHLDTAASTYGMSLLMFSLGLDGVLASFQNFIKEKKPGIRIPNAIETMLWMNLYANVFLIPVAVYSGQWTHGVQLLHDSELVAKLALLNATVAGGQIFIFLTIAWYTPVITTTITTTRKFFTILLSVWAFGHAFTMAQWTAVGLVFTGLYLAILRVQQRRQEAIESKIK